MKGIGCPKSTQIWMVLESNDSKSVREMKVFVQKKLCFKIVQFSVELEPETLAVPYTHKMEGLRKIWVAK